MSVYLRVHTAMPMHFVWKFEDKLAGICSHPVVPDSGPQAWGQESVLTDLN